MPIDFVKQRIGASDLAEAVRQQEQLSYFTRSSIQKDLPDSYIKDWAERNVATDDDFLNYAKTVFRADNFLTFASFLRTPIISAELVEDRIKPELSRVFFSENSYTSYTVNGENFDSVPELESKKFKKEVFDALLFNHNDIVVTGLKDINTPFREIVKIKDVVSIESGNSKIHRIAYGARMIVNGVSQRGYMYLDSERYVFLDHKYNIVAEVAHDLGETPADYISNESYGDCDVVRKSIFSKVVRRMENYVFLDTMLRMTEPNGVIPVATILKSRDNNKKDTKTQEDGEPMSTNLIGGQKASQGSELKKGNNLAQPGSTIYTPIVKKDDGSIDMNVVQNYINFFHMPVEPLRFIEQRVEKQEKSIVMSVVGDFSEASESAMNELQVGKGYKSKEDRLRELSFALSVIVENSDRKFLALQHGKDSVEVDIFFGSDFFTETQEQLNKLFESSANPIERQNVLIKSSMNRNRFNQGKLKRERLLYKLLPYGADKDFETANAKGVDPVVFEFQTRFNYWIGLFEAQYGDIVAFADSLLEESESAKILVINGLIVEIIRKATIDTNQVEEISEED